MSECSFDVSGYFVQKFATGFDLRYTIIVKFPFTPLPRRDLRPYLT